MADVTGPVSTLPGARHTLPEDAVCDAHPNRKAVARVQGETDSFGSELNDMCQECLDQYQAWRRSPEARSGRCDWCKNEASDLSDTRDIDEGMGGPVYRVCGPCRKKYDDELLEELDYYDSHRLGPWDDYD